MKRITILAFILCSCFASLDWSQEQWVLPRIVQSAISHHDIGILQQTPEPQTTSSIALKKKYPAVEVEKFDVLEGLQFPTEGTCRGVP